MSISVTTLTRLISSIRASIEPSFLAFDEDDEPGIMLTIGADLDLSGWAYKTGDPSFAGSSDFYPISVSEPVYQDTQPRILAYSIFEQLMEESQQFADLGDYESA